jgi:ribosomal protein S18 acetylase RimI-like enzyme
MESTLELQLQLLAPADWRILRTARLRALFESPNAFTSSHARERAWDEPEWRRLFESATWVIAREAELIGLAKSVREPGRPWARHLESIWVAPTHRRGVLRALLRDLAKIDQQMGVTDLMLWVLEDNYNAQRAYEALGFEPTGEREFLLVFGRFERRLTSGIRRLLES